MRFGDRSIEANVQAELDMPYPAAKIGGWPYWLQHEEWTSDARLLFQLSDPVAGLPGIVCVGYEAPCIRVSWQPD